MSGARSSGCPRVSALCTAVRTVEGWSGALAAGGSQAVVAQRWAEEEPSSEPRTSGLWFGRAGLFERLLFATAGEDEHLDLPLKENDKFTY